MEGKIDVVFSQEKKRLTILKDGNPVGGFAGNIAVEMYKKITFNNVKIEVSNGSVQVGI